MKKRFYKLVKFEENDLSPTFTTIYEESQGKKVPKIGKYVMDSSQDKYLSIFKELWHNLADHEE